MIESIWQSTCAALRGGSEPDWEEVYDYRRPLQLVMAARYGNLPAADREDLVENILLDIKQRLFRRYLPDRGPFRAFLCGVVRMQVLSRWKRNQKRRSLELIDEPGEVPPEDGLAIDLVAEVLGATRRWSARQGVSGAKHVQILAERLLGSKSHPKIARSLSVAPIKVKRTLQRARKEIVADLLERTLPQSAGSLNWTLMAECVLDACRRPQQQAKILTRVGDPRLRLHLESWLEGLRISVVRLPGRKTPAGSDLCRGLEVIFYGEGTAA